MDKRCRKDNFKSSPNSEMKFRLYPSTVKKAYLGSPRPVLFSILVRISKPLSATLMAFS
jgi:hypothetical protein